MHSKGPKKRGQEAKKDPLLQVVGRCKTGWLPARYEGGSEVYGEDGGVGGQDRVRSRMVMMIWGIWY